MEGVEAMLPFRRILFPVDYSEACNRVVPYVRETAGHFGAAITVVHACGPVTATYLEPPMGGLDLASQVKAYEEERLKDFARECLDPSVERVVALGEPGTVIQDVVRRNGTDLVMMPTHGGGHLRRLLLGSVTTKVLHDVSAAVWTITAKALERHKPGPYRSILCALELAPDDESAAVVVAGSALAKSYGAALRLAHVVTTPRSTFEVDFAPFLKDLINAADAQLRQLKASLQVDAPHQILEGNVADGVRRAAEEASADLIVVGRGHAQGTISRVWSDLYTVVREAPCPVLSI
jgi:nucleotide-binding universal stress UspA family protein